MSAGIPGATALRERARLGTKAAEGLVAFRGQLKQYARNMRCGSSSLLCHNSLYGFASANYWSSSENNANNAWKQNFDNGNQNDNNKNNENRVRAARGFVPARTGERG